MLVGLDADRLDADQIRCTSASETGRVLVTDVKYAFLVWATPPKCEVIRQMGVNEPALRKPQAAGCCSLAKATWGAYLYSE